MRDARRPSEGGVMSSAAAAGAGAGGALALVDVVSGVVGVGLVAAAAATTFFVVSPA